MSARREKTGASFVDLQNAIEALDLARRKALAGDEELIRHFLSSGLTLWQIEGKTPCELYVAMAQRRTWL